MLRSKSPLAVQFKSHGGASPRCTTCTPLPVHNAGRSLTYGKNDSTELVSYSDSGWAANTDDRRSTKGYVFILSGGSIAWATQKQRTVALSSTGVEYMALTECMKHAQWTIFLLQQLDFEIELPLDIFSDSLGARAIASNAVFHKRTKHINVIVFPKYHWATAADIEASYRSMPVISYDEYDQVYT